MLATGHVTGLITLCNLGGSCMCAFEFIRRENDLCQFYNNVFSVTFNNFSKSVFILYPYTAERRDVLENTLPEAQEISQGRGFCTPRPERLPEGEARGQSRGPRGAKSPHKGNLEGRGGCIFRYIPTRGSVRTFFHHYQGTIDFVA